MNGGDGRICAFQSSDCPTGTSFVTPRMLEQGGGSQTAHGGACATNEGSEVTTKIGSCFADGYCASDVSLCTNPQDFVQVDDRCTVRIDGLNPSSERQTTFGKCMTDNTCYWSQKDCLDTGSWKTPNDGISDCTCEGVRVGACVDSVGFYYCAVSEDACYAAGKWIDALSLQSTSGAPDCFLCRQTNFEPIQVTPTDAPPVDGQSPSAQDSSDQMKGTSRNKDTTSLIVGVSIGGAVFIVLVAGILVHAKNRISRRGPPPTKKSVSDIPVETIVDSSSANIDMEGLSDDDGH